MLDSGNMTTITIRLVLDEAEKRRICYLRDANADVSVEFFPKFSEYFVQPKPNEAIFFVNANCAHNGLVDISPR